MAQDRRSWEREREARAEPVTAPAPAPSAAARVARQVGNQAFARIAREGAGILPDGRAHPDVERAIAETRGGGRALDPGVRDRVGPALGDGLQDVRVHDDADADALASSVSAHAFTTGRDIYFAQGEYAPGTAAGERLLTHELAHAVQQRDAPASGPLTVSQPGDPMEVEAERAAGELG